MSAKQIRLLWPAFIAAILLTSLAGASIWAMKAPSEPTPPAKSAITPPSSSTQPVTTQGSEHGNAHGPVQVVRFTLYDVGILPRQARVSKGLVAVTLNDLSDGNSGLIVERQNNGNAPERAGQVSHYERSRRGRAEMKLEPGIYAVFDAETPEHRAELIVE